MFPFQIQERKKRIVMMMMVMMMIRVFKSSVEVLRNCMGNYSENRRTKSLFLWLNFIIRMTFNLVIQSQTNYESVAHSINKLYRLAEKRGAVDKGNTLLKRKQRKKENEGKNETKGQ